MRLTYRASGTPTRQVRPTTYKMALWMATLRVTSMMTFSHLQTIMCLPNVRLDDKNTYSDLDLTE